jgi:hypothetical protein
MDCSWGSMTPAPVPSASTVSTSSMVTALPSRSRTPMICSTPAVETVRSVTKGLIALAMTVSGPATTLAMASAWIKARRLGTSSPRISEK